MGWGSHWPTGFWLSSGEPSQTVDSASLSQSRSENRGSATASVISQGAVPREAACVVFILGALYFLVRRRHGLREGQRQRVAVVGRRLALGFDYAGKAARIYGSGAKGE